MTNDLPCFLQKHYQGALGYELPDNEEQLFQLEALPILDPETVKKICGNDDWEDTLTEMLNIFLDILPKEMELIEAAYHARNWQKLEDLAHRMKGGCLYGGLQKLAVACQFVERYIKAGHSQKVDLLYEQMIHIIHASVPEIKQWLNNHTKNPLE